MVKDMSSDEDLTRMMRQAAERAVPAETEVPTATIVRNARVSKRHQRMAIGIPIVAVGVGAASLGGVLIANGGQDGHRTRPDNALGIGIDPSFSYASPRSQDVSAQQRLQMAFGKVIASLNGTVETVDKNPDEGTNEVSAGATVTLAGRTGAVRVSVIRGKPAIATPCDASGGCQGITTNGVRATLWTVAGSTPSQTTIDAYVLRSDGVQVLAQASNYALTESTAPSSSQSQTVLTQTQLAQVASNNDIAIATAK
ncbi:MAG: hypothetical protein ACR2F6_00070 [Mycobacteriales bacterium]